MRIATNSVFEDGLRAINRASAQLAEAQRQVSTGKRISSSSADPLGSAAAVSGHGALARMDSYTSAADAATYRLSVADSVLSDIVEQLTGAQSAALSARNSTATAAQRAAASAELLAIRDAIMADLNTQVQGDYLFGGTQSDTMPFSTSGGTISAYQGSTTTSSIDIANGRSVANSLDGSALAQGSDAEHVLTVLTDLAAAVSSGDAAAIETGVQGINRAFDRAVSMQSAVGNDLRTIDEVRAQITDLRLQTAARLKSIEQVDLADAMVKLSEADAAYRAALGAMSTVGRLSLMDYLR